MTDSLLAVRDFVADRLEEIRTRFIEQSTTRITCIIRSPHLADGDMIVTDDDLDEVIKAVLHLKAAGRNFQ